MNTSTWILIITLLLAILFFVIASFLSSDDESKKSAKTGLNGIGGICITIAFFTGVYKFFTRDKGVANNGNGNAGKKNGNGTPLTVDILQKKVANLKEALVNEVTNKK